MERAEAGTRPKMTETDRRNYRGVARHPLGRKWMLQRYIDANEAAERATDTTERKRWTAVAERVRGELRRLGVGLEERP